MLFKDTHSFLSNFARFPYKIKYDGIFVDNIEVMYQAEKASSLEEKQTILKMTSKDAKKYWKGKRFREDFDRIGTMRKLLPYKYKIPMFFYLLTNIKGDIVEDNYHQDTYWGKCNNEGENHLGILLTELRDEYVKLLPTLSKIKIDNLYEDYNINRYDYIGFTANSIINKYNGLVMGKGNALTVKNKFTGIDLRLGSRIAPMSIYGIIFDTDTKLFALQSKIDFRNVSTVSLIKNSLDKLKEFALANPNSKIACPVPGVENGRLQVVDILPLMKDMPTNITFFLYGKKIYTGIGSRNTPIEIAILMTKIATYLERKGYTLRSGGANGADVAFEKGVKNSRNKEIYLPDIGFNKNTSNLCHVRPEAMCMSSYHHEYWKGFKDYTKKLMGRNAYQVLGYDLNMPTDFIICYTQDGCEHSDTRTMATGGTGLAISIGTQLNIKVYNLGNRHTRSMFEKLIK